GLFVNQGEACGAGSRMYVHRDVYEGVLEAVVEKAKTSRQGPGVDWMSQMGPLVSRQHMERVLGYIRRGLDEGAKLLTGGEKGEGQGYFVKPTVMEAKDVMRIAREGRFGPVLAVMPLEELSDVVKRANATS